MGSSLYDVVVLLMQLVEQKRVLEKPSEKNCCLHEQDLSASFVVKHSRLQEATLWAILGQSCLHNSANLA